jgi:hypothetical protein
MPLLAINPPVTSPPFFVCVSDIFDIYILEICDSPDYLKHYDSWTSNNALGINTFLMKQAGEIHLLRYSVELVVWSEEYRVMMSVNTRAERRRSLN